MLSLCSSSSLHNLLCSIIVNYAPHKPVFCAVASPPSEYYDRLPIETRVGGSHIRHDCETVLYQQRLGGQTWHMSSQQEICMYFNTTCSTDSSTLCQDGKRLNKTGMQKHQPFYYIEVDSRCVCVCEGQEKVWIVTLQQRFNTDITLQMIVQTASPLHRRKSDDFIPLRLCTSWLSAYWWPSWQCSVL